MIKRTKNILIFLFCIIFAAVIYVWFYPLDYGYLNVSGNVDGFNVIAGGDTINCPDKNCSVKVKTGTQIVEFSKEGYVSDKQAVQIVRFKTGNVSFSILKIPDLIQSDIIPEKKPVSQKALPDGIDSSFIISPSWNPDSSRLAYVDLKDDRLKIYGADDNKIIVSLKNLSKNFQLIWSPDGKYLFGSEGNGIYFINIDKFSRKKEALAFSPQYFKWVGNTSLLANDESGDIYIINMDSETISPLSIKFDLEKSEYGKDGNLVSYSYDDNEKLMSVESFNANTREKVIIFTKSGFLPGGIQADDDKNIYIYNSADSKWYLLDY